MKYEDSALEVVKIKMREKTYNFPQLVLSYDKKEMKEFYGKQLALQRKIKRDEFLHDFLSIIWMSYRKNFDGIKTVAGIPKEYHYTTDNGWGCMIRGCQMLLSNCILKHFFNGPYFTLSAIENDRDGKAKYLGILWQY